MGDGLGGLRVLDPAIDPSGPMTFDAWSRVLGLDADSFQAAICASRTYEPGDDCADPAPDAEDYAEDYAEEDEREFLALEWDRQIELGRDPAAVLGEHPPWS